MKRHVVLTFTMLLFVVAVANTARAAPTDPGSGQGNRVIERPWWWKTATAPAPTPTSVSITGDVLFAVDSAELTPSAASQLASVLALANSKPTATLTIAGYTDNDGPGDEATRAAYNDNLSFLRAASVANWLVQQGVARERLIVVGHGESEPVAPNDSPAHKATNRRVSVTS